jgi:SH3-like domain-containing protein
MFKISPAVFLLVMLVSCEPSVPKAPVIGEAFVGPAKLDIHAEIVSKSPVVATGSFGEKLQVIGQRRHFLKVRTAKGVEGWVDDRNLLDSNAINSLKALAADSKKYPSQGLATTYDTLNVHTEPNRSSTSYLLVQPGERVAVIGHRTAPRKGAPRKPLVIAQPKAKRPVREKKTVVSKVVPPPPLPPAPRLPADWLELSLRRDPDEADEAKPAPKAGPVEEVAPPDDWTLIRNANGQAGWVLTRRIFMAIPDEVAQYAEGKRITSYFSLGKIDGKDTWLWTTCQSGPQDHEIEGFRVFSWNPKRKRYETTYIQRRVLGYYPVLANGNSFSVLIEKDGKRYRQHFTLIGNRVKFDGEELEAKN